MKDLIEKFKETFTKEFGHEPHMDTVRLWVDQNLNEKMKTYVTDYLCDRSHGDLVKLTKSLRGQDESDIKPSLNLGSEEVHENGKKKPSKRKP